MNKKSHLLLLSLLPIRLLLKFTLPVALLFFTGACATTSTPAPGAMASETSADLLPASKQSIAVGDQLYRQGDAQAALYHYIAAFEKDPGSTDILYRIGISNVELGNIAVAAKVFKQILTVSPAHAGAHEGLGLQYLNLRQYDAARTHLNQAIDAEANRTRAQNALGILADLERDHNSAKTHFIAGQGGKDVAVTYNNVGFSRYLAGDWTAAEQSFQTAIAHNPEFERAVNNLGLMYVRKGEYSRAFETFSRSMPAPEAYNNVGYFCMLTGQHEKAAYYLQRAIDESPRYYARAEQNLLRNVAEQINQDTTHTRNVAISRTLDANTRIVRAIEVTGSRAYVPPPSATTTSSMPQQQETAPGTTAVANFPEGALICRVGTNVLRVRKNADPEALSISAIYRGQEVAILLERNVWVQISYLNAQSHSMRKGWINSDYLQGDENSTACGALGNGRFGLTTEALDGDDIRVAAAQLSQTLP